MSITLGIKDNIMRYIKFRHLLTLDLILLVVLFVIASALDSAFGVSLFWQFYVAMVLFAAFVTIPKFLFWKSKQPLWLFATFTTALCTLHFVVISPEKSFLLLQRDITDGMTVNEVQNSFNQRFPKQENPRRPTWEIKDGSLWNPYAEKPQLTSTPDQKITYKVDANDGDIGWLVVYFRNGRTVGNEYIPPD